MKEDWIRSSTVGRNAYINGFMNNSPAWTKMAINQKVLDVIKQGSGFILGLISEKNTYIIVQVP